MEGIKDWLKGLFENNGKVSSMRVMSMISLLTGCYIGISGLYQDKNLSELSILCGTFLSSSMAGKVFQKVQEIKGDK
jgi:hypothetical protein